MYSKPLLTLAALSLLTMSSGCEKTQDAAPVSAETPGNSLVGEWDWVITSGGLTGHQTYTPAATGVNTTWVFKADSTFQQYDTQQGVTRLTESTTFSVSSARSIYTGQTTQALRINRHVGANTAGAPLVQPVTYIIQEIGTQLKIADNFADGFGQTYQRK